MRRAAEGLQYGRIAESSPTKAEREFVRLDLGVRCGTFSHLLSSISWHCSDLLRLEAQQQSIQGRVALRRWMCEGHPNRQCMTLPCLEDVQSVATKASSLTKVRLVNSRSSGKRSREAEARGDLRYLTDARAAAPRSMTDTYQSRELSFNHGSRIVLSVLESKDVAIALKVQAATKFRSPCEPRSVAKVTCNISVWWYGEERRNLIVQPSRG